MRALHVIPSAAPVDGGPNLAVRALARELVARGIDVTVATTNAAGDGTLEVPLDAAITDGGVAYRYFARSIPGTWKFSWPLTRWLWANVDAYDVVHVHALFSYATIPACRAAAHASVPYVLRPLGTLSAWSLAHRRWKKRPYYALLERSHLAGAAAIHVTSDTEAADVVRLGYGERVRVIPLGVDVPDHPPVRPRGSEGPFRLLFLSRLHPKKNVPALLRAMAAVAPVTRAAELVIAGAGEPTYREELERLVSALGLGPRVRFVGHVDGEPKNALFRWADCFVLPSADENFGLAVAEALGAGLPAIVTPNVALASRIAAAEAGLVTAAEPDALGHAIAWAADHPRALVAMGERAWGLARDALSWSRSCALLADLYDELARSRRRARRLA